MKYLNAFLLIVAALLLGYIALLIRQEWPRITQLIREEADQAPFVNCFPVKARFYFQRSASVLDLSDEELGEKIAEVIGDDEQVALAVCRAFGTLTDYNSSWGTTTGKERRALAAIHTVKGDSFLNAMEKLKEDPQALLGAAYIFFYERFSEKIPKEKRTEWSVRLAKLVLTDGWDGNKHITLRRLGEQKDPQVTNLLRDVFRGKVGKEIDFTKAWNQEPGLGATAAVLLAQQNDQTIQAEVKQLLKTSQVPQDVAALEVALALFGDPSYIQEGTFPVSVLYDRPWRGAGD